MNWKDERLRRTLRRTGFCLVALLLLAGLCAFAMVIGYG